MAEKVTTMILKSDLQCHNCYKKVKKILCKFPQIRDQTYDEKNNSVKITVVCCSPEEVRDKLCCKGYKVIKSIEIVVPPTPEETKKSPPPKKTTQTSDDPPKKLQPAQGIPLPYPACLIPVGYCCVLCSAGYGGGPCYCGHGRPVPRPRSPCYGNYGYGYSYGRECNVSRCEYFSEENAAPCTVM